MSTAPTALYGFDKVYYWVKSIILWRAAPATLRPCRLCVMTHRGDDSLRLHFFLGAVISRTMSYRSGFLYSTFRCK